MSIDQLAIASYNCNGLADRKKRGEVFTWLKNKSHQIFYLQETHSLSSNEVQWRNEWDGPIYFSHGSRSSKGVMILLKKQLDLTISSTLTDTQGRWIIMNITTENKNICLVNVYAPNTDEPEFFEEIRDMIQNVQHPYDFIVMAGDFNTVINTTTDRKGNQKTNYHKHALEAIINTMDTLDLVEVWRLKNPDLIRYTWRRATQASRIDYFLISFSLLPTVNKIEIEDRFRSDHSLISLHIKTNEYPRGPGYWKFNQTLLEDNNFKTETKQFITDFFKYNIGFIDPMERWDMFKCAVRDHTIKFASWKQKQLKNREKDLIKEIVALILSADITDEIEASNKLEDKQKEYERLLQEKAANVYLGQKAEWMEKGEKTTKYFLKMQHSNTSKKNITKLYLENGNTITSPVEILKEEVNFFAKIFSFETPPTPLTSCSNLFPENFENKLSEEQKNQCEGPITEEELYQAILTFNQGKSPGFDGIPVEFYKSFFELIKVPLLESFNCSYERGCLSETQKNSLITLLLKQDPGGQYKDPGHLKNWRPLALQSCDSKILAKCIALRIKKVISSVIHHNQTGFLTGRYIGDNIRQLLEFMEHYNTINEPGLIFIADFEKAFDKLRHDFVFKCLSFFNFGESLIKWVKLMNKDTSCKIINNGYLSENIPLLRGVKQGCPLSTYLFILGIEILAIKIRSNENIKGLEICGMEEKVSIYADDSNFPLIPKISSLNALTDDLDIFSTFSGLKPNYEKCTVLRIGSLKGTNFSLKCALPIKWSDGPVDVLGIHIPQNTSEIMTVNFHNKLKKIDKILQPWRGKMLSIYGKIALINSLVVSQFTYLFMSLPTPSEDLFNLYEQKIFKFIWNNKPEKIKRKYLYNDYDQGGQKLLNLEALNFSLKANLIPKLYHNTNWFSSKLLTSANPLFGSKLFPFLQIKPELFSSTETITRRTSTFLKDALKKWLWFQYYPPDQTEEILQQIIWFNSNILIQGKPFYWEKLFKKKIIFINDITDRSGTIMSHYQFTKAYGDICPFHEYTQLTAAIPSKWKTKISKGDLQPLVCRPCTKNPHWLKYTKINKAVYNFYMSSKKLKDIPYQVHIKWESLIDCPIPWKNVFNLIYQTILDSSSRYFQIKLIYNFLATKRMLKVWGIEQSDLCRFCKEETESTPHLFWYCPVVAKFWTQVEKDLCKKHRLSLDLGKVLLGDLEEKDKSFNNIVILLGKMFIFKQQTGDSLHLNRFKQFLKHHFILETIIADTNGTNDLLLKRWDAVRREEVLSLLT